MNKVDSELKFEVLDQSVVLPNDQPVLSSTNRRRLIKLGASAAPVIATLSGQSALAGVCVTTSAWGSDQVNGSSSQAARHLQRASDNNQTVSAGYTIAGWNTAANPITTPQPCWAALKAKYSATLITSTGVFRQNVLTFAQLATVDSSLIKVPSTFTSTARVIGSLTGTSNELYFLIAQLNYAAGKTGNTCFSDTDWRAIVAGTYNPQSKGVWSLAKTVLYLKAYNIVLP